MGFTNLTIFLSFSLPVDETLVVVPELIVVVDSCGWTVLREQKQVCEILNIILLRNKRDVHQLVPGPREILSFFPGLAQNLLQSILVNGSSRVQDIGQTLGKRKTKQKLSSAHWVQGAANSALKQSKISHHSQWGE